MTMLLAIASMLNVTAREWGIDPPREQRNHF